MKTTKLLLSLLLTCFFLASQARATSTTFFASASPTPPVTFCDSMNSAVADYRSIYAGYSSFSKLFGIFNNTFGSIHYDAASSMYVNNDDAYWFAELDSCGISDTTIMSCTLAGNLMSSFYSQYPQYAGQCAPAIWLAYLNSTDGQWNSEMQWRKVFSVCGISLPVPDTPANFCDSLRTALAIYHATHPSGSDLGTLVFTLNSYMGWGHADQVTMAWMQNDASYWRVMFSNCSISPPQLLTCAQVGTFMSNFNSLFPQYSSHAPAIVWASYLNGNNAGNGYSYSPKDWSVLLGWCGISYPAFDTLTSYCDTIRTLDSLYIKLYPSGSSPYTFMNLMVNATGIYNYDFNYWSSSLSACSVPCNSIYNCSRADSLMTAFKAQNPAYATHAPAFVWANYMNRGNVFGDNNSYNSDVWISLFTCCGISYPSVDTLGSYCDSLSAVVTMYNSNNLYGSYPWVFADFMKQTLNDYGHLNGMNWEDNDLQYWITKTTNCGIACPHVVDCHVADSIMASFYSTYPLFVTHAPAMAWSQYLNIGMSNYLNSINAGNNGWNNADGWTTLLTCCNIPIPARDTLITLCDSLTACVSLYTQQYPNGAPLWNFTGVLNTFMPYQHYDQASGQMVNNSQTYWMPFLDSCHISYPSFIDCQAVSNLMHQFKITHPADSTHCFPVKWVYFLNQNGAAPDGNGGNWWYNSNEWIALLNACHIPFPTMDSLGSRCDSIQAILQIDNNGTSSGLQDPTNDLNGMFGWQHYDATSNQWMNNTTQYWFSQISQCSLCSLMISCDTLSAAMNDFVTTYPQYATHCPSKVVAVYMDVRLRANGVNDDAWPGLFSCCNIAMPADTVASQCDDIFVVRTVLRQYEQTLDSSLPVWLYSVILQSNDINMNYGDFVAQDSACGLPPINPINQPMVTHCDSMISLNYVYQLFNRYRVRHPNDQGDLPQLQDLYSILYGYGLSDAQIVSQIVACDTNSCLAVSYPQSSGIVPIFNSYGSCLPVRVFTTGMNTISGMNYTYSQWCAQFARCGDSCRAVCDSAYTACDSVREVNDMVNRVVTMYGLPVEEITAQLFSTYFGRDVSFSQAQTMIAMCTPGLCDSFGVSITSDQDTLSLGDTAILSVSGANSYNWSTGETTSSISVIDPGTYSVTARSADGCTTSDNFIIVSRGNAYNPCGTSEYSNEQLTLDSSYKFSVDRLNTTLQELAEERERASSQGGNHRVAGNGSSQMKILPVVFNIVRDISAGINTNITMAQIQSQLDALNQYFLPYNIQFCLATKDISTGSNLPVSPGYSSGIFLLNQPSLVNISVSNDAALKATSSLSPSNYLRIWVVNSISAPGAGGMILGYANVPGQGYISQNDGIVVDAHAFGNGSACLGCISTARQGKTLVHEVGHWLGLYHPWEPTQDPNNTNNSICASLSSNCFSTGDFVCDTYPLYSASFSCSSPVGACTSNPVQVDNYMQYTNDACRTSFTSGQAARMTDVLANAKYTLTTEANLVATAISCSNFYAYFYASGNINCVNVPETFTAPNALFGAFTYSWDYGDGSTLGVQNPTTHSYVNPGNYTVTLTLSDGVNVQSVTENIVINACTPIESDQGNWFFGKHAGLNFATGNPVATSIAQINNTIDQFDGAISQSDDSGNLLFYSDGTKVWDKNHLEITDPIHRFTGYTNVTGVGLVSGTYYSGQAGISIPDPSGNGEYYLFTLPSSEIAGLKYAKIHIDVNNQASILNPTNPLINVPLPNGESGVSTCITAIPQCGAIGYWIIIHGRRGSSQNADAFFVYSLTSSGISPSSQIYHFPSQLPVIGLSTLKASPDGSKLACAFDYSQYPDLLSSVMFNFDRGTGVISSPYVFTNRGNYGISFSPNSKVLYLVDQAQPGQPPYGQVALFQYDLTAANPLSSERLIFNYGGSVVRALQIGPDDKIYLANPNTSFLSVLQNPNSIVNPLFIFQGPTLVNYWNPQISSYFGLPNMIDAKPQTALTISGPSHFCIAGSIIGTYSVPSNGSTYTWSVSNNGTILSQTANSIIVSWNPIAGSGTIGVSSSDGYSCSLGVSITSPPNVHVNTHDVDCNLQNGTATAVLTGLVSLPRYSWNEGSATQTISSKPAGPYTVTVHDGYGCSSEASGTISFSGPTGPTISNHATTQYCNVSNQGSMTVTVAGGAPTYNYDWGSNHAGNNSNVLNNITGGTYGVTVTDQNGCSVSISDVVGTSVNPSITGPTMLCYGAREVLHANSGYSSYNWSTSQITPDTYIDAAGIYSVTVSDGSGCVGSTSITVTQRNLTDFLNAQVSDVSCPNLSNGSIELTAACNCSSQPLAYRWADGNMNSSRDNLPAGNYSVTVTDANGNTASAMYVVHSASATQVQASITPNQCSLSTQTGSITINPTSTNGPFSYAWSNGANSSSINNLGTGNYTLTISDNNSCTSSFNYSVNALHNDGPSYTFTGGVSITPGCASNTGWIQLDHTTGGGTPGLNYLWSKNDGNVSFSSVGYSSTNVNGGAGTYTVTITDGAGCSKTTASFLMNNSKFTLNTVSNTPVSCYGGNNGSINVSTSSIGTGPTLPLTYLWSGTVSNTSTASNLLAQTYYVTVTDQNGCSAVIGNTVTGPDKIKVNLTTQKLLCHGLNNGFINTSVSGGTAPYTFDWGNGVTTQNRINLSAGNYSVTVTDNHNCTSTAAITLDEPSALSIALDYSTANCNHSGWINACPTGGTENYAYIWSDPSAQTTETATNLAGGAYTVTVTDANACSSSASANIGQTTTPGAPTTNPVSYCQGITASVLTATGSGLVWYTTATGGIGSYSPQTPSTTSVGSTNYYVSQSINGCEGPRSSLTVTINSIPSVPIVSSVSYCLGATATPLTASGSGLLWYTTSSGGVGNSSAPTPSTAVVGTTTYYVSQKVNGCESARASLVVTISAQSGPTVSPVSYCAGSTATLLSASGGNLLWYTSATGGVGSSTAPVPSTSTPGTTTYYVSQTVNGCESQRSALTVTINTQPSPPSAAAVNYCYGVTPTALSATGTNIKWYTSASGGNGSTISPTPSTSVIGTTNYYATQTSNGCESSRTTLTVTVNGLPSGSTVSANDACDATALGTVIVSASGGAPSYTYDFGTGFTQNNQAQLAVGSYNVTIEDANNCRYTLPFSVALSTPIDPGVTFHDRTCDNDDGSFTLNATGGSGSYQYFWSFNCPVVSTTRTYQDYLSAGTYSVTVVDGNGCSAVANRTVTDPVIFAIGDIHYDEGTCGANLSATMYVGVHIVDVNYPQGTGGNPPYSYTWYADNNFQNPLAVGTIPTTVFNQPGRNPNFIDIISGTSPLFVNTAHTYELVLVDSRGCSPSAQIRYCPTTPITYDEYESCNELTIIAHNGVCQPLSGIQDFDYHWSVSSSSTNGTLTPVQSGSTYNVTITSSTGDAVCTAVATINYSGPEVTISAASNVLITCPGSTDHIQLVASSNMSVPVTYRWSTTETGNTIDVSTAGLYSVTATDASNCTVSTSYSITANPTCCTPGTVAGTVLHIHDQTMSSFIAATSSPMGLNGVIGNVTLSSGVTPTFTPGARTSTIYFSGTVIFDVDFDMLNCQDIRLAPGTSLIVNDGQLLTIDNSVLQACGTSMWQGITVNDGASIDVKNNSLIADAQTAIMRLGDGLFKARDSKFYRDNMGIVISGTAPFSISNNGINGNSFVYNTTIAGSYPLLSPYAGKRPQAGIVGVMNPDITIGDDWSSAQPNLFQGLNCGIWNFWSTMTVSNNSFSNIKDYNNQNGFSGGCAVYAYGGTFPIWGTGYQQGPDAPTIVATSPSAVNSSSPSRFDGNTFAVKSDWATMTVYNNSIHGGSSLPDYAYSGVVVNNAVNRRINVGTYYTGNVIHTAGNYMSAVDLGVGLGNNTNSPTNVASNVINVNPPPTALVAFPHRFNATFGISQSELSNTVHTSVRIYGNTINGGSSNIYINNAYGTLIYGSNYLNLTDNNSSWGGRSCIQARNCSHLNIESNILTGNGNSFDDGYAGSASHIVSSHRRSGIYLQESVGSTLCGNVLNTLGYSIAAVGNCGGTVLDNQSPNVINGAKFGLMLQRLGVDGQIGAQGSPSASSNSRHHTITFNSTFNNNGNYRTYTVNSSGSLSKFYYASGTNEPLYNGSNVSGQSVLKFLGGTNTDACGIPIRKMAYASDFSIATAQGDISQYAEKSLSDGAQWSSERKLYQELLEDTTLGGSDTTYQQFMAGPHSTQLGNLSTLENLYGAISLAVDTPGRDSIVNQAVGYQGKIIKNTTFAQNAVITSDIYLRTVARGYAITDSNTLDTLRVLASSCPMIAGDAVYMARSLYNLYYPLHYFDDNDLCNGIEEDGSEMGKTSSPEPASEIDKVYDVRFWLIPNPASKQASVYYTGLNSTSNKAEVYNTLGQKVLAEQDVELSGRIDLNVESLPTGVYMVRLIADDKSVYSTKLVVTK